MTPAGLRVGIAFGVVLTSLGGARHGFAQGIPSHQFQRIVLRVSSAGSAEEITEISAQHLPDSLRQKLIGEPVLMGWGPEESQTPLKSLTNHENTGSEVPLEHAKSGARSTEKPALEFEYSRDPFELGKTSKLTLRVRHREKIPPGVYQGAIKTSFFSKLNPEDTFACHWPVVLVVSGRRIIETKFQFGKQGQLSVGQRASVKVKFEIINCQNAAEPATLELRSLDDEANNSAKPPFLKFPLPVDQERVCYDPVIDWPILSGRSDISEVPSAWQTEVICIKPITNESDRIKRPQEPFQNDSTLFVRTVETQIDLPPWNRLNQLEVRISWPANPDEPTKGKDSARVTLRPGIRFERTSIEAHRDTGIVYTTNDKLQSVWASVSSADDAGKKDFELKLIRPPQNIGSKLQYEYTGPVPKLVFEKPGTYYVELKEPVSGVDRGEAYALFKLDQTRLKQHFAVFTDRPPFLMSPDHCRVGFVQRSRAVKFQFQGMTADQIKLTGIVRKKVRPADEPEVLNFRGTDSAVEAVEKRWKSAAAFSFIEHPKSSKIDPDTATKVYPVTASYASQPDAWKLDGESELTLGIETSIQKFNDTVRNDQTPVDTDRADKARSSYKLRFLITGKNQDKEDIYVIEEIPVTVEVTDFLQWYKDLARRYFLSLTLVVGSIGVLSVWQLKRFIRNRRLARLAVKESQAAPAGDHNLVPEQTFPERVAPVRGKMAGGPPSENVTVDAPASPTPSLLPESDTPGEFGGGSLLPP